MFEAAVATLKLLLVLEVVLICPTTCLMTGRAWPCCIQLVEVLPRCALYSMG